MRYLKLYESTNLYPSNEDLAKAIFVYRKKYPNDESMSSNILAYLKATNGRQVNINDINNYESIFNLIHNPSIRYGSSLVKNEFIKIYYNKILLEIDEDKELIEDTFFEIWPNTKSSVRADTTWTHGKGYIVLISAKENDIPDIIRTIIKSASMRLPKNYKIRDINIDTIFKNIEVRVNIL